MVYINGKTKRSYKNEDVESLINLYDDWACLWDVHEDYISRNKKAVAYCQIDAICSSLLGSIVRQSVYYVHVWPFVYRYNVSSCNHRGRKIFSVFTSHLIKTKNRNHSMNKVKNLGYDRWLIYKQPRQESGLYCFSSRVICRSVSPKFLKLCMGTPCLRPSEGHKHGGRKVTETSVTEFCYWNAKLLLYSSATLK